MKWTSLEDNSSVVTNETPGPWIWIIDIEHQSELNERSGKWMYYFSAEDTDFADKIAKGAVLEGIVAIAKYTSPYRLYGTNSATGVICFYLNGDDITRHKKVISYFLKNNLIRRTKNGRLYNISFKYDDQTRAGQYKETGYKAEIKLSDFVDLNTGEFLS